MSSVPDPQGLKRALNRPWVGNTLRYGSVGAAADWQVIRELYYQDNVKAAYEMALSVGDVVGGNTLGFFRLIEGEYLTREASEIDRIDERLQFESSNLREHLKAEVQSNCSAVASRLGWSFEVDVLVTLLVAEADNPWHGGRYGYYMDKYPYDKVCIPGATSTDPGLFRQVLSHEYAHVITTNLTNNRAPHWVEEGISQTMEGREAKPISSWINDPVQLNAAFDQERRGGSNHESVANAYAQAHRLVLELHRRKGDSGLAEFLRAYADNGAWEEIKIATSLDDPTDEALRQVYELDQKRLFEVVAG